MYDKLVMQYAFNQNILKKQQDDYDGGSELFTPTLTTNGLCYSFNSENYSSVWKESEVTYTFNELLSADFGSDSGRLLPQVHSCFHC